MSVLTPSFIRFHSAPCLLLTEKKKPWSPTRLHVGRKTTHDNPPQDVLKGKEKTHQGILRKDFTLCLKANDHNESVNLTPIQYKSSLISENQL